MILAGKEAKHAALRDLMERVTGYSEHVAFTAIDLAVEIAELETKIAQIEKWREFNYMH